MSWRGVAELMTVASPKAEALAKLPSVFSMIDRLAKKNIIHSNKASNLKSKLTKHVAKL